MSSIKRKNPKITSIQSQKQKTWAGYTTFVWVIVFILFHFYWYFGGRIGLGDASEPLPSIPHNLSGFIFSSTVILMFIFGTIIPIATVQSWGRLIPRWMVLTACWFGNIVLILRGGAGFIDDISRMIGFLPNGITGMTYEQIFGDQYPSLNTLWSSRVIDVYFFLGGILYGLTALFYQRKHIKIDMENS